MSLEGVGGLTDFLSSLTVQDEGSSQGVATTMNFVGAGVVASVSNGVATITVTGGAGGGDVSGPASSTDNAAVRFDGATGKIIQNSLFIIDDLGSATATAINLTASAAPITLNNNGFKITLGAISTLSADRPITLPNASGTLVLATNTATFTNKGIDGGSNTLTNIAFSSLTSAQPAIQFQDEGVNLSTEGGIKTVNFTGAAVDVSATGSVLTVRVSATGGGGSGTVESVSVVSANGFKGTVASATTTPKITIDVSGLPTSKIAGGAFGRLFFATATTAAAQSALEAGTVGLQIFKTTTTAAAQNALGGGTVGVQVFQATTTALAQQSLGGGTVGRQIFESVTSASAQNIILSTNVLIKNFGITVDGGGSAVTTGSKGYITVPYQGTISNWYLAADVSGSVVVDVKRSGASIIGTGNKPTLSGDQFINAAVSGWTSTAVSANDIFEFNVDSATTLTRFNLVVRVNATT